MKKTLALLLLLAATGAFANGPRQPFPDDYTPHPCAPEETCQSIPQSQFVDMAALAKGFAIDNDWLDKNWSRMIELTKPACGKLGTCLATQGNLAPFCMDVIRPEMIATCDRFEKGTQDFDQCSMFMRTFAIGADLRDKKAWQEAQGCAAQQTPRNGERTMEAWIEPADFSSYDGSFRVYAIDTETHVPVMALVSIPDTTLRAGAPGNKPYVGYDIKWKPKFLRIPNADGHTNLAAPKITVTAENYAPVTLDVPMKPGEVIVEMTPPANELKRGKNTITVTARDAATNKPVELRVLAGETILGDTNKPLEIELEKGQKRPEIWATSLFNVYDDVVIAPAEK